MTEHMIVEGDQAGRLGEGLREHIRTSLPAGSTDGTYIRIARVSVEFTLERAADRSVPNIDPWAGYGSEAPHPHNDGTGHSHEPVRHARDITQLPSWGQVGC